MISKYKKIFSVSTLTLLLAMTPVVATAQSGRSNRVAQDDTTQTTTATEETAPSQTEAEERQARLAERKAALKTRLDAARQARIKSRCKASQGKLSSISGRIQGLETSRAQVYANLIDRLTKLNDRLKTAGVDTTELDSQITQLNTLIDTFNTDLGAYKLSVGDIAVMDCAADPIAFQATLETARTSRTKAADSAKAIRAFLTETIKPTLSDLKAQFAQNKDTNQQTEAQTDEDQSESEGSE